MPPIQGLVQFIPAAMDREHTFVETHTEEVGRRAQSISRHCFCFFRVEHPLGGVKCWFSWCCDVLNVLPVFRLKKSEFVMTTENGRPHFYCVLIRFNR